MFGILIQDATCSPDKSQSTFLSGPLPVNNSSLVESPCTLVHIMTLESTLAFSCRTLTWKPGTDESCTKTLGASPRRSTHAYDQGSQTGKLKQLLAKTLDTPRTRNDAPNQSKWKFMTRSSLSHLRFFFFFSSNCSCVPTTFFIQGLRRRPNGERMKPRLSWRINWIGEHRRTRRTDHLWEFKCTTILF